MRVLLTNAALDSRAGSELYCRDVAIGLRRRGHRPVVFAPVLGEVARELRDATVPIVDDLDDLGEPPEVIHGQHHLPTVMAILRFPGVPAVYVCHGWRPWNERPPRLRRIRRYVAVDEAVRDRLVFENGVPERLVRILPNFVDLDRFPPRSSALPERPQRALLFSNYATESSPYARAVREASREFGIEVDIVGAGVGRTIANPGEVLRSYDLVFAQGRSAIEAMAAGASVVVASSRAFGPLVTSSNVRRLRELNFGIRALDRPPAAESLIAEIRRYDSADATAVSQIIRTEAALDPAIDALVSVYKESAEESSGATEGTRTGEVAEIVAYLRSLDAVSYGRRSHPRRRATASRS